MLPLRKAGGGGAVNAERAPVWYAGHPAPASMKRRKKDELLRLSLDAVTIESEVAQCLEFFRAPRASPSVITPNATHPCIENGGFRDGYVGPDHRRDLGERCSHAVRRVAHTKRLGTSATDSALRWVPVIHGCQQHIWLWNPASYSFGPQEQFV